MSYSDLLKDPRWQRKRLEVLERDEWMCQRCGDTSSTLHVHHRYYLKGKKPWEYPDECLQVLCEVCHQIVTHAITTLTHLAGHLYSDEREKVIGYARVRHFISQNLWEVSLELKSFEMAVGAADAVSLPWKAVTDFAFMKDGQVTVQDLFDMSKEAAARISVDSQVAAL